MTALRDQAPGAATGNAFPSTSGRPSSRRPSGASRPVGAAGQARRSLQRDLARREAGLRISRRVSGPGSGERRAMAPLPEFLEPEAAPVTPPAAVAPAPAPAAPRPVVPGQDRRADLPGWRPDLGSPAPQPQSQARRGPGVRSRPAAAGPQRRMSGAAPQARPAAPRPVAQTRTAPQARTAPQTRPVAARPQPQAATSRQPQPAMVAAPSPAARMVATAAAAVAQPGRLSLPFSIPRPPVFRTLPGGVQESATRSRPKLSTAAVFVMAVSLLVVTIGAVVALQIRVTQVNERMGEDLGAITTVTQQNIALRERLTRQTTSAVVDNVAANRKMIEPDVSDTTFRNAGNRKATALKAAEVLKTAPVAPTGTGAAINGTVDESSGTAQADATALTQPTGTVTP